MSSIQEKLRQDLADVAWTDLLPHSRRDAVIVVHETLDIVTAAEAIASDDSARVQVWIDEQLIQKPTQQQLSQWNAAPQTEFSTLIVQPYVLVSPR